MEGGCVMKDYLVLLFVLTCSLVLQGCGGSPGLPSIVVNTLEDIESPEEGVVSLRSALALALSGQTISFDSVLDAGVIELTIVSDAHSVLVGEWQDIFWDPVAGVKVTELYGYFDRDYGASALYASKNVVIDASGLPNGITIAWAGDGIDARVLAVYGNLTMTNVTITGGKSVAEVPAPEDIPDSWAATTQTATLARGGGLAVWGLARLTDCTLHDNICDKSLDLEPERDQGAFGGGLFADVVDLRDCVISGNSCVGSGVSGGGVFSVGGAEHPAEGSTLDGCSVTGNLLAAGSAYGAGVYSDGGGIGKRKILKLTNCTVAWNVVDGISSPHGYWRGGGIYMSNGFLELQACTIVDNHVSGYWREDLLGKCSLAGGVAATIGLAHAAESMTIGHCIIAGNTVTDRGASNTYDQDIFTGSLLYFNSRGYNRIGVIDFSQMLVPVGEATWWTLCRRHYPKIGDIGGVEMADVLDTVSGLTYSTVARSMGVDAPGLAVLHYEPTGNALDAIPTRTYRVAETFAEYQVAWLGTDNFLEIFLARVEAHFPSDLVGDFASDFTDAFEIFLENVDANTRDNGDPEPNPEPDPYEDPQGEPILTLADTAFFGPAETWVKESSNYPLIHFWHQFDVAIVSVLGDDWPLGDELIGDALWEALFDDGELSENGSINFRIKSVESENYSLMGVDQLGTLRPENSQGDIGAIERVFVP